MNVAAVITAIKTAIGQKRSPLDSYVSFNRPVLSDEDSDRVIGDVIHSVAINDPADRMISSERIRALTSRGCGSGAAYEGSRSTWPRRGRRGW